MYICIYTYICMNIILSDLMDGIINCYFITIFDNLTIAPTLINIYMHIAVNYL